MQYNLSDNEWIKGEFSIGKKKHIVVPRTVSSWF